jgi:hypothetical protein
LFYQFNLTMIENQQKKSFQCSICYSSCCEAAEDAWSNQHFDFAIFPNCSHYFCLKCTEQYWKSTCTDAPEREKRNDPGCPICREPSSYYVPIQSPTFRQIASSLNVESPFDFKDPFKDHKKTYKIIFLYVLSWRFCKNLMIDFGTYTFTVIKFLLFTMLLFYSLSIILLALVHPDPGTIIYPGFYDSWTHFSGSHRFSFSLSATLHGSHTHLSYFM